MCGRFDLTETPAGLAAHFGLAACPAFAPNRDARPTQSLPVVRVAADGGRECALLRWGLVPPWARDLAFGARCINARSETLARLPAFRSAFRRRRCLVPVNGFYEWAPAGPRKQRYWIGRPDGGLFALAGLWERWEGEGTPVETFTIVTTAAREPLRAIHERMPVLVPPADYAGWLDPSSGRGEALLLGVPTGDLAMKPWVPDRAA